MIIKTMNVEMGHHFFNDESPSLKQWCNDHCFNERGEGLLDFHVNFDHFPAFIIGKYDFAGINIHEWPKIREFKNVLFRKPSGDDDYPYDKIMLPGDIEPVKYHLSLHPNVTHTLDYTGTVKIFFKVIKDTKNIILHSLDITHYDTGMYIRRFF